MNFFQLFISLSCVSATVIPTLSGSSTEALATTMTGNNDLNLSVTETTEPVFNWKSYEKLLGNGDFAGLSEAYKNGAIDFSYIPRTQEFYRTLVDNRCTEGYNILKGYFDSGVIADMVEMGWLKYQDIFDVALTEDNYNCVNLALDRLIAIHAPEIQSPNYKTKSEFDDFIRSPNQGGLYPALPRDPEGLKKHSVKTFYARCSYNEKPKCEKFKFIKNFFLIFETLEMEPWMVELRRQYIFIMFYGCDL